MSFDPDYPTKPLEYFKPMITEIFTREPFDPKIVSQKEFEQLKYNYRIYQTYPNVGIVNWGSIL